MPKKSTSKATGAGTRRGQAAKGRSTGGRRARGGRGMEEGRPAEIAMGGEAATATATAPAIPTHDQIAQRAREIWERRGYPQGQDREIWLEAEEQLRKQAEGK